MGVTKFTGTIFRRIIGQGFILTCKVKNEFHWYAEIIKTGLIDLMLTSLKPNSKHVVLSCDGKLIGKGLTEDSSDIYLQCSEEIPTLEEHTCACRKNR